MKNTPQWAMRSTSVIALTAIAIGFTACKNEPKINCQSSALIGDYNEGRDQAERQNNNARNDGRRAGQNLTRFDGISDGNAIGWDEGYSTGYWGPLGYDKGYSEGESEGYWEEYEDPVNFLDGAESGRFYGTQDGDAAGNTDGYNKGYSDGWDLGLTDGELACLLGDSSSGPLADGNNPNTNPTQADRNYCLNQGYNAAYDSNAYSRGYEEAKNANSEYQSGYSQGYGEGRADGETQGRSQGFADGKIEGYVDGANRGQTDAWDEGYASTYWPAYNEAYDDGYWDHHFGYGSAPNFFDIYSGTGGYGDGYPDGWWSGYNVWCGDTVTQEKRLKNRRWGQTDAWKNATELAARNDHGSFIRTQADKDRLRALRTELRETYNSDDFGRSQAIEKLMETSDSL